MALKITERMSGNIAVLDLEGQICYGEIEQFDLAVNAAGERNGWQVLLNIAGVDNIDSLGLPQITLAALTFSQKRGELKLLCPQSQIGSFLKMIGFDKVLSIFTDERTAVNAFR